MFYSCRRGGIGQAHRNKSGEMWMFQGAWLGLGIDKRRGHCTLLVDGGCKTEEGYQNNIGSDVVYGSKASI